MLIAEITTIPRKDQWNKVILRENLFFLRRTTDGQIGK